jgi:hypothetical protein
MSANNRYKCWSPQSMVPFIPVPPPNNTSFTLESSDTVNGPINFSSLVERNTKIRFVNPRFRFFRRNETVFIASDDQVGFSTEQGDFTNNIQATPGAVTLTFPISGPNVFNDEGYNGSSYTPPITTDFNVDVDLQITIFVPQTGLDKFFKFITIINGSPSQQQIAVLTRQNTTLEYRYKFNTVVPFTLGTPEVIIQIEANEVFTYNYRGTVSAFPV